MNLTFIFCIALLKNNRNCKAHKNYTLSAKYKMDAYEM